MGTVDTQESMLAAFLATLTEEQKQNLGQLLTGPKKTTKKVAKKPTKKVIKKTPKKIPNKTIEIEIDGEEQISSTPTRGRSKTKRKKTKQTYDIKSNLPKSKGIPAAKSNIKIGPRPNKFISENFLSESDRRIVEKESEGDKNLYKTKQGKFIAPTTRDRVGKVESTCKKCNCIEEISIKLLTYDEESRGNQHICDDCVRR